MGLGPEDVKLEGWGSVGKGKDKGTNKKKSEAREGETGCWIKFRLMVSCISSRSKVDTSISSASTHCGNLLAHPHVLYSIRLCMVVVESCYGCCVVSVSDSFPFLD